MGDIFSAFGDIFGDMFGGFAGGGSRASARGADLETRVELSLAEVAKGATKEVKIRRRVACERLLGDGRGGG